MCVCLCVCLCVCKSVSVSPCLRSLQLPSVSSLLSLCPGPVSQTKHTHTHTHTHTITLPSLFGEEGLWCNPSSQPGLIANGPACTPTQRAYERKRAFPSHFHLCCLAGLHYVSVGDWQRSNRAEGERWVRRCSVWREGGRERARGRQREKEGEMERAKEN